MEEANVVSSSSDQPNPLKRPHPQADRHQVLDRLCSVEGGFGVVCETLVTLYRFQPTESNSTTPESGQTEEDEANSQWKVVDYGIPAVIAEKGSLMLSLGDIESGGDVQQFALQSTSQYTALDEYFHVFLAHPRDSNDVQCYGLSFPDVAVAKKILGAVKQLLPCTDVPGSEVEEQMAPPDAKRSKVDKEDEGWVVIEHEDIPELLSGADAEGGVEATDSAFRWSSIRRKKSQEKSHVMEISEPKDFKHISHVGKDTPISEFTQAMSGDLTESQKIAATETKLGEPGTEISSSFEAAAPPPPPPPPPKVVPPPPAFTLPRKKTPSQPKKQTSNAQLPPTFGVSLEDILQMSATLRPTGDRAKTLPRPPPKPERKRLVYEINTFSRTTLRHISPKSKDSTDSHDEPLSMQSLLKAGLEKMRSKLQNVPLVANISSEGDEEGFEDEFDGALFVEE